MNSYLAAVQAYLNANPIQYPDPDLPALLESLYECYVQRNVITNDEIRQTVQALRRETQSLSFLDADRLFDLIFTLCYSYEHAAFLAGTRAGATLMAELMEDPPV